MFLFCSIPVFARSRGKRVPANGITVSFAKAEGSKGEREGVVRNVTSKITEMRCPVPHPPDVEKKQNSESKNRHSIRKAHSHSIVLSHGTAQNFQRKLFLRMMNNRLPDPSETRALEFKGEFRRFGICSISTTIGINRSISSSTASDGTTPATSKMTVIACLRRSGACCYAAGGDQ